MTENNADLSVVTAPEAMASNEDAELEATRAQARSAMMQACSEGRFAQAPELEEEPRPAETKAAAGDNAASVAALSPSSGGMAMGSGTPEAVRQKAKKDFLTAAKSGTLSKPYSNSPQLKPSQPGLSADEALLAELIAQGDSVMAKLDEAVAVVEECQPVPATEGAVATETPPALAEAVSPDIAEFSVPLSEMSVEEPRPGSQESQRVMPGEAVAEAGIGRGLTVKNLDEVLTATKARTRGKIRAKARQQVLLASQDDRLRLALTKARVVQALDSCVIREDLPVDAAPGTPIEELDPAPCAEQQQKTVLSSEEPDLANLTQATSPQGGTSLSPCGEFEKGGTFLPPLDESYLANLSQARLDAESFFPAAEADANGKVDAVVTMLTPIGSIVVDEAEYMGESSATVEGQEQQTWAASVLGTLAKETPIKSTHGKKKGLKRASTHSILRDLGFEQIQNSPTSKDGNSIFGQQGSNSIRSKVSSAADSDWMIRSTWTPPSPPAPSSSRTEQPNRTAPSSSRAEQPPTVPSLLMPATGLRISPCNSATSQKARAANVARSGVPGLDMKCVNMGYDEDEDTEDDKTGCKPGIGGAPGGDQYLSSLQISDSTIPSESKKNENVPQLDMSSLQFDGASSAFPSKNNKSSSGSRNAMAPRDGAAPGPPVPWKMQFGDEADLRPVSRGAGGGWEGGAMQKAASTGDLRPVIPGARAGGAMAPPSWLGAPAKPGYTKVNYNVDTGGNVVAGTEKAMNLDAAGGLRLPPLDKGAKGKKSKFVSHVHMHHHLHYHVNRTPADLSCK